MIAETAGLEIEFRWNDVRQFWLGASSPQRALFAAGLTTKVPKSFIDSSGITGETISSKVETAMVITINLGDSCLILLLFRLLSVELIMVDAFDRNIEHTKNAMQLTATEVSLISCDPSKGCFRFRGQCDSAGEPNPILAKYVGSYLDI